MLLQESSLMEPNLWLKLITLNTVECRGPLLRIEILYAAFSDQCL